MDFESSKLINLKDLYHIFVFFSYEKDKKHFTKILIHLIIYINIIIVLLISFIFMIQKHFILKYDNFLEYEINTEIIRRRPFEKLRESRNWFGDILRIIK